MCWPIGIVKGKTFGTGDVLEGSRDYMGMGGGGVL